MRTFIDAQGREWTIDLNIASLRKLRARAATVETLKNVDLLDYAGVLLSLSDPFFAADLLFETLREDADDERGISAEDFGASLRGVFLFDAIAEWTAEYLDFFPEPTAKEKAQRLVEKGAKTRELLLEK
ncbi:MAG: hypothetical protein Q4Q42_06715, partial [Planctomycetia bacterium]|nr:hypothetical protein [Planctomycetia bacterium]